MAKINLLSSKVYNRIAAGEVVERPASVVKELIENSLDAGATEITAEIENGGISVIKISDNGCGIEKSELKKALLPHATSKICSVKDLDEIQTLGFRGEALASIASVSAITVKSKPKDQNFGAEISQDEDGLSEISDSPLFDGTEITVNNLFYNAPVRAKFLKSERSEENEITACISRFILGRPDVAFKYIADGEVLLQSYGDGEESAFVCVYGTKIVSDCYKIESEKNGIKISGYIGKQYFTRSNRNDQTVFLNGRFVKNQTLSSAIGNAYSSYMMKRQYPFYVLSVKVPSSEVDVNVHPNKIDVRFTNNNIVYGAIYSMISKVLDGASEAVNIVIDEKKNNQVNTSESKNNYVSHNSPLPYQIPSNKIAFADFDKKEESLDADIFEENKAYIEKLEKERQMRLLNSENTSSSEKQAEQSQIAVERKFKYIGQALNTFLIFDDGVDLFLVDQHAAHERMLFDKFMSDLTVKTVNIQPLLVPYVFEADESSYDFIIEKRDFLLELGIEISEFGRNTFRITTLPAFLLDMNIGEFIKTLLEDTSLKTITAADILKEKIASKACKAAIKAGFKITDGEVEEIKKKITENPGLKCPHGRPVVVKITLTEIEKWFKRIV